MATSGTEKRQEPKRNARYESKLGGLHVRPGPKRILLAMVERLQVLADAYEHERIAQASENGHTPSCDVFRLPCEHLV